MFDLRLPQMIIKRIIAWVMTPCSPVEANRSLLGLRLLPEDGGGKFLRNIAELVTNFTALLRRTLCFIFIAPSLHICSILQHTFFSALFSVNIFIFVGYFNTLSVSDIYSVISMMIDKLSIIKYLERIGFDLIKVLSRHLSGGTKENRENPQ
jgi:hypothetical protein